MSLLVSADLRKNMNFSILFVYFKFTAISVNAPKFVLCSEFGFFIFLNFYIKSHGVACSSCHVYHPLLNRCTCSLVERCADRIGIHYLHPA